MRLTKGAWQRCPALAMAMRVAATIVALAGRPASAEPSEEQRRISEAWVKLERGEFGRDDRRAMESALRKAPETWRPRYEAVLARHERDYEGDPAAAIRRLAPLLLSAEHLAAWQAADGATPPVGRSAAAGRRRAAAPPVPPPYPPPATWTLNPALAEAACEAARAWAQLDDPAQAIAIVDTWGRRYSDAPRALAAECAGDLLFANGRTAAAIESYRLALGLLREMARRTEGLSPEQRLALARAQRNLKAAERKAKIEKHGPGWYAYYEAGQYEARDDPLQALWAWDRLVGDYPDTVYAEAARAYGIRTLLRLAEAPGQARARQVLDGLARNLAEQRAHVAGMRRAHVAPRPVALAEEVATVLEARYHTLKALPQGPAAEREAFARAEAFLAERPKGLYRGETLLALARWTLEGRLDLSTAPDRYLAAWAWLEEIGRGEAALDAYEVPREAAEVSRPPRSPMTSDRMGNLTAAAIEPGMVINRRTCAWYLDGLKAETALALGFLAWLEGDNETARTWYGRADVCDPRGRALARQGWSSAGLRLQQALVHGRLHAEPEERRQYQGKQRLAVTLAEFHYCTNSPERVLAMTDRLLAGDFGPMSSRQAQYPRLLRGLARYVQGSRAWAEEELRQALAGPWTITQDRAAFALANVYWGARRYADSGKLLEQLAGARRSNDYVHRAQLALGLRLKAAGAYREALHWLDRLPETAPYYAYAQREAAPLKRILERK